MFRDILLFLIDIVFSLFGIALILRAWMSAIRLHPFNPYSQAILRASDWLVRPLSRILPPLGRLDLASLLACWLTALVYLLLTWIIALGGALPPLGMLAPAMAAAFLTAEIGRAHV